MGAGACGLWLVGNAFRPSKYIWSLEVTNSTARASRSICEYLLSVSVNMRLT